jgi:Domain of unknown function (DUF397)
MMTEPGWRKSSFSGGSDCVEVKRDPIWGDVQVRDSKDAEGSVLTFTATEWRVFLAGVKAGEFDTDG